MFTRTFKSVHLALAIPSSLAFLAFNDKDTIDKSIQGLVRTSRTLKTCTEIVWDYHKTLKLDKETNFLELKSSCHQRIECSNYV